MKYFDVKKSEFDKISKESGGLVELEAQVVSHARKHKKTKNYCANRIWYSLIKPELITLVGWDTPNKVLNNSNAYDIAYGYLYDLLPDCNHEGMCTHFRANEDDIVYWKRYHGERK